MKRVILLAFLFIIVCKLEAQEKELANGVAFGFHLSQYQNNFGMGLNVASPYFLYEQLAVKLRGNMMFNEHIKNAETVWTPYSSVSLGLSSGRAKVSENIEVYGEGGLIALFPSAEFSSESTEFGGYGLFAFEFYMSNVSSYFIELGGVGVGAIADKVAAKPIYSNGFLVNVGFKIHI